MESFSGRLCDAHKSAGTIDPIRIDAADTAISCCGCFRFRLLRLRRELCFMTLAAAQGLSGAGDVVNVLELRLNQPERAGEIAEPVRQAPGPGFSAETWVEENRAVVRALGLEKVVTAIFIGLITFVAGLNILVVLSMTVTDKARDIAVLRSMGARREQIRTIFLWQGISIGAMGTLIGLVIGYTFSFVAARQATTARQRP